MSTHLYAANSIINVCIQANDIHDADRPCTDDCACYDGKCTKYGSKVSTKIIENHQLICEYLHFDYDNKCVSRANLPKLQHSMIVLFFIIFSILRDTDSTKVLQI